MSFTLIFLVLILGIFVFFLTASTSTVKTIHHTSLQMPQILIDKDVHDKMSKSARSLYRNKYTKHAFLNAMEKAFEDVTSND